MTSDYSTLFWIFLASAAIMLLAIILVARVLLALLRNNDYIDLLKQRKDERISKGFLGFVLLSATEPVGAVGEALVETSEAVGFMGNIGLTHVLVAVTINVVLIGTLVFLARMLRDMKQLISVVPEVEQASPQTLDVVGKKITQLLSDRVDIDEEHTILMDHEYDGIRELDNNLPPWWKWGFYVSIITAVLYLCNYHVFGFGDLPHEAYVKEMAQAEVEIAAYLEASALNVDESSVVTLTDLSSLGAGEEIFVKNCAVCHLEDGGGQTGPNLTDDHWLYGPDIVSIFKTVKYGAKNGMTSWQKKLTPIQIQEVSSYIRTMHGTIPANPKAPQGEIMEWLPEIQPEDPDGIEQTPATEETPESEIPTEDSDQTAGL